MSRSAARCIPKSANCPAASTIECRDCRPAKSIPTRRSYSPTATRSAWSQAAPSRDLLGCETIRVNSLHGQGILEPGKRVVVEGVAEDGTIEAIRIADAPGFALGVQWHAEYDPQTQPDQPGAVSGVR